MKLLQPFETELEIEKSQTSSMEWSWSFPRIHTTYNRGRIALIALASLLVIWILTPIVSSFAKPDRPLVLYSYFETPNARTNAEFFINHGLHDGADFVFILNGPTDLDLMIPSVPWVTVNKRPNTCFDLGSHARTLMANDGILVKTYKRFILMNASIRGPFMPTWSNQCWSDAYLDKLDNRTKMVGMTYNCKRTGAEPTHLSSMILALDDVAMKVLIDNTPINNCFANKEDAIHVEASLSGTLQAYGYNVTALMTAYQSDPNYQENCNHDDVNWNAHYFGTSIHPYETMFQKANRNIWPEQLELLTKWTDEMKYDSQKFCGSRKTKSRR